MAYITTAELKAYMRNELGAVDDGLLDEAIDAATLAINHACQRSFDAAGTATSARVYVPTNTTELRIHDCTSVTAVTVGGTAVASDAYQLEPLNGINWVGEARPYDTLRRIDPGGYWPILVADKATVSVTATWGWSATPAPVRAACRIVAAEVARQRDVRFGVIEMGEAAGMSVRSNRKVGELLGPYRRAEAWAFG